MTENSIAAALSESVQEVLEKMFFVDLVDLSATEAAPAGIAAELFFDGDPPGSFRLLLDDTAARSVAADFLGEDPAGLAAEQLDQIACELANMICGSVLSRIESSASFRLSKPQVTAAPEPLQEPPEAVFQANVAGGMLRAEIRMERSVCPGIDEFES